MLWIGVISQATAAEQPAAAQDACLCCSVSLSFSVQAANPAAAGCRGTSSAAREPSLRVLLTAVMVAICADGSIDHRSAASGGATTAASAVGVGCSGWQTGLLTIREVAVSGIATSHAAAAAAPSQHGAWCCQHWQGACVTQAHTAQWPDGNCQISLSMGSTLYNACPANAIKRLACSNHQAVQRMHQKVCSLTALAEFLVVLSAACMQRADCKVWCDISQGYVGSQL